MEHTFQPRSNRVSAIAVWVLGAIVAISTYLKDLTLGVQITPAVALGCWIAYVLLWHPAVIITQATVIIRNPLQSVTIPWPAIHAVTTKFTLTLHTAYGTFAAWAAPAPGKSSMFSPKSDTKNLPETTYVGGSIGSGDLPASASGQAAMLVRDQWERLRRAGHLDNPVLERQAPLKQWHVRELLIGALLAIAAVAGVMTIKHF